MTSNINSKPRPSARIATGLALSALLVLAMSAGSVRAEDRHDDRGHGDRRGYDHHGGDGGWTGGYYAAPPVVYGTPYYAPPPVVYGPAVGISLPGVSIGIR